MCDTYDLYHCRDPEPWGTPTGPDSLWRGSATPVNMPPPPCSLGPSVFPGAFMPDLGGAVPASQVLFSVPIICLLSFHLTATEWWFLVALSRTIPWGWVGSPSPGLIPCVCFCSSWGVVMGDFLPSIFLLYGGLGLRPTVLGAPLLCAQSPLQGCSGPSADAFSPPLLHCTLLPAC